MFNIQCNRCEKIFPVDYDKMKRLIDNTQYDECINFAILCDSCGDQYDDLNAWYRQKTRDLEAKLEKVYKRKKEEWLKGRINN